MEKEPKKELIKDITDTTSSQPIPVKENQPEKVHSIEETKKEQEITPPITNIVSSDKKEIADNNLELHNLNSDQKLEKKIKDLEEKLDNLNNNVSSSEQEKHDDININNNLLNKYELSDITKAYLDSYLDDSSPKAELSDFSKAYMTGLTLDYQTETKNEERPALSGFAMEFLNDNYEGDNTGKNKMEIIEEKEEENNN